MSDRQSESCYGRPIHDKGQSGDKLNNLSNADYFTSEESHYQLHPSAETMSSEQHAQMVDDGIRQQQRWQDSPQANHASWGSIHSGNFGCERIARKPVGARGQGHSFIRDSRSNAEVSKRSRNFGSSTSHTRPSSGLENEGFGDDSCSTLVGSLGVEGVQGGPNNGRPNSTMFHTRTGHHSVSRHEAPPHLSESHKQPHSPPYSPRVPASSVKTSSRATPSAVSGFAKSTRAERLFGTPLNPYPSKRPGPALKDMFPERQRRLEADKKEKERAEKAKRKARSDARQESMTKDPKSAIAIQAKFAQEVREQQAEENLERERILRNIEHDEERRRDAKFVKEERARMRRWGGDQ